ncbi:MAG: SUF system Fe-S cluster assembly protein [Alphaproteobacteria bacterium]
MTQDGNPAPGNDGAEGRSPAGRVSRDAVIAAISTVYDPEIPVNIYELGLIYRIDIDDAGRVAIEMTVTAPACPVADILPTQVADAVRTVAGVADVAVDLVWDPPWRPDMMSEAARLELGMF